MKKLLKKLPFIVLTALLLTFNIPAAAAAAADDGRIKSPSVSRKINLQNYETYGVSVRSTLYQNADKTFTRVEHLSDEDDQFLSQKLLYDREFYNKDAYIAVEQYTSDFTFISG